MKLDLSSLAERNLLRKKRQVDALRKEHEDNTKRKRQEHLSTQHIFKNFPHKKNPVSAA